MEQILEEGQRFSFGNMKLEMSITHPIGAAEQAIVPISLEVRILVWSGGVCRKQNGVSHVKREPVSTNDTSR